MFVDDATRATFTGNRRFSRLQRQVFGADLMRRARNHLYRWKRAGFDQASYRVCVTPKVFAASAGSSAPC